MMSPNQQDELIEQNKSETETASPSDQPISGMTKEEAWAPHPEFLDTARLRISLMVTWYSEKSIISFFRMAF